MIHLIAHILGLWFLLSLATLFLWIGGLWIYPRVRGGREGCDHA